MYFSALKNREKKEKGENVLQGSTYPETIYTDLEMYLRPSKLEHLTC